MIKDDPIRLSPPWWAHPLAMFSLPMVILAYVTYLVPGQAYAEQWRTWKHFDGHALAVALAATAAFSAGALAVARLQRPAGEWEVPDLAHRLYRWGLALTLMGYLSWFGVAFARGLRPALMIALITGQEALTDDVKKNYMGTVSGVTTLTQLGMATLVLGCLWASRQGWREVRWGFGAIFSMAVLRSILNSERLAVIELAIPAMLAAAAMWPGRTARVRRWLAAAPVIGVFALFTFFTASESLRSWKSFYSQQHDSLLTFAAIRLTGYYTTALNNGACLEDLVPGGFGFPYYTALFAWRLPLIKNTVREIFDAPVVDSDDGFFDFIGNSVNIEFNNPSGVFLPVVDFGIPLGLAYWLGAGLLCGWVYTLYRSRRLAGVCLYPLIGTGLLEASRVLYWAESRSFPSFVWLAVAAWLLTNQQADGQSREIWQRVHLRRAA
jgi:hypothetical protein